MLEFRTKLRADGRIVMPAECRRALHLIPGEELIIHVKDGEATLFSLKQAVVQAQKTVQKYTKAKKNLTEQLIATRRKEAKRG